MFVCVPGFVIPKIFVSYFNYYTTNLGNDAFELSIPMWWVSKRKCTFKLCHYHLIISFLLCSYSIQRLPFHWKSPKGYFTAVLLEMVVGLYPMCYLGTFISLAVGAFIFAILALKELKGILKSLKKRAKSRRSHCELLTNFFKFYQSHTDLKQLSKLKCSPRFMNQMNTNI